MMAEEDSAKIMKDEEYSKKLIRMYEKKEVKDYFEDFFKFSDVSNRCVLDAGCGIGYASKRLKDKDNRVLSFDTNVQSINYAKETIKIPYPLLASVNNVPFKDKVFDNIYFLDVLEHLHDPLGALRELYRVLKDEGELILITPNGLIRKLLDIILRKDIVDITHIKEFTLKELKALIAKAGFTTIDIKASGIVLLNKLNFRFARWLAHKLNGFILPLASPSFWVKVKKVEGNSG